MALGNKCNLCPTLRPGMTVESALKERACCIICKRLRLKEAPTPGSEPEKKDDQAKEPEAQKKPEKAEVPEKEEDPKDPAPAPPPPPPIPPPAGSAAPAPDLADRPAVVAAAAGAPGAAIGDPDHSDQEFEVDLGFDNGDHDELFRSGEAMAAAETRAEEAEAKAEAAATRAEEAEAKAEAAEKRAESAEALRSVYEQKLTNVCNLYEKLKQQVAGSSGVPTASKPTASKPRADAAPRPRLPSAPTGALPTAAAAADGGGGSADAPIVLTSPQLKRMEANRQAANAKRARAAEVSAAAQAAIPYQDADSSAAPGHPRASPRLAKAAHQPGKDDCGGCGIHMSWDRALSSATDHRHRCTSCNHVVHAGPYVCKDIGRLDTTLIAAEGFYYCDDVCHAVRA